jgi:hypothetical protein
VVKFFGKFSLSTSSILNQAIPASAQEPHPLDPGQFDLAAGGPPGTGTIALLVILGGLTSITR